MSESPQENDHPTFSRREKVLHLSLGQGLTALGTIVSAMVMARLLSETQLATFRQTLLAYETAVPLLLLAMEQCLYYRLPVEQRRPRGLVVDAVSVLLLTGLIFTLFVFLGGNHLLAQRFSNPAIAETLTYMAWLPLIALPTRLTYVVLIIQNQTVRSLILNVFSNLMLVGSLLTVCWFYRDPSLLIYTKVIVAWVTGLIALVVMFRAVPGSEFLPNANNMLSLAKFGFPLMVASAIGVLSLQLDKIIVSSMCTPVEFAVYSIGAMEVPLISIITGSVMSVILPDLRRMLSNGESHSAIELFRLSAQKTSLLLLPMMVFLWVFAEPLMVSLFSEKYLASASTFRYYLLIIPMRIVVFGAIMTAMGLNKTILYRAACGLLVNTLLSILFVRLFGFNGAVLATLLSLYLVEGVWSVLAIAKTAQCSWKKVIPFGHIFMVLAVSFVACVPTLVWQYFAHPWCHSIVQITVGGGIFVSAFFLAIWAYDIDNLDFRRRMVVSSGK